MGKVLRKVSASEETMAVAKASKNGKVEIYSFFPADRYDCECQKLISETKKKLKSMTPAQQLEFKEKTKYLKCPRDHSGMKRYKITCEKCGEIMGYLWATSYKLEDWCDFHYYQYCDKDGWHGCFTANVSPVTGKLTLECCCGQDTRDFSLNRSLPPEIAEEIENKNKIGRNYGLKGSKFFVSLI